ncbi:cytochrome c3 family protein [Sulfurimonas sp.]|uniref:cytochrome c3 family protein n=1 Tax=Sulfurimonas sp. TaxID=2022749 RepID=UPI003568F8E9
MIKKKLSIVLATLVLSVGSAYAETVATAGGAWAVDGTIAGTPHDLSGTVAGDNGEICVYCHTPHAANTAFDGAPLWNKKTMADTTSFQMYGATATNTAGSTIAGTATSQTPESPSLACLSCHDGVSAIDSIVNAPGSGMGSLIDGTPTTITANTTDVDNGNIGQDLTNDHPVSIVYTEGTASLRLKTTTLNTITGGGDWVGASTVGDLLRGPGKDMVECGSCHDPHNGYASDQGGTQVNYLRRTNAGSQLCLGCHAK